MIGVMAPVHGPQDGVGARLNGQVEVRHGLRQIAVGGDQLVVHVVGMARGVAQPRDSLDLGEAAQEPAERPAPAVRALAVPGVDVLADQGELAHAGLSQGAGLVHDALHRARELRAARVGHHAEGAELVAALLHGEEGGHAARQRAGAVRRGQMAELVVDRELGVDHAAAFGPAQQLGQAVIALGADHEINGGLAPLYLGAFRLRHAAGDHDPGGFPRGGALAAQHAQLAKLGVDLLGRLLADMAGVEHDQVRIGLIGGLPVALGRQEIGHALPVIDVHLAAIGLDVDLLHGPLL